jgi:hypothetical protein
MKNIGICQKFIVTACLVIVFLLCGCQEKSPDKIPISGDSEPVVLSFEVYNHTQGFLTDFKRTLDPGARVAIRMNELDVKGVGESRMVIREDRFGKRIAFTQTRMVTFQAPKQDKNYSLYLMNASNGADYRIVDTWINNNEGVLEYVPPLKWFLEDKNGFQGPEEVIRDAINQLNEALDFPWAQYGSLQRIDQRQNSSFGVGYGYSRNQFGWHSPYWAGVNPDHCSTYKMKLATFLEEIFELVTRLNDIGGEDTASYITDPETGNLNEVGKDLLAYVFVKDEKIGK